jgi:hypothetical protein
MSGRWGLFESVPGPVTYHPAEGHLDRWWLVRTPRFGLYVQRINVPMDTGPSFHTHPRPRITLVVRGRLRREDRAPLPQWAGPIRRANPTDRVGPPHAHDRGPHHHRPTALPHVDGRPCRAPPARAQLGLRGQRRLHALERTPRRGADRLGVARPRRDHRTGSFTGRGRDPTRPAPAGGHEVPC